MGPIVNPIKREIECIITNNKKKLLMNIFKIHSLDKTLKFHSGWWNSQTNTKNKTKAINISDSFKRTNLAEALLYIKFYKYILF